MGSTVLSFFDFAIYYRCAIPAVNHVDFTDICDQPGEAVVYSVTNSTNTDTDKGDMLVAPVMVFQQVKDSPLNALSCSCAFASGFYHNKPPAAWPPDAAKSWR